MPAICEVCREPTASNYGVCQRNPECKREYRRRHYRTAPAEAPVCELCEGPLKRGSTHGICTRKEECRLELERRKDHIRWQQPERKGWARRYRAENREAYNATMRAWNAANPEKVHQARRRARRNLHSRAVKLLNSARTRAKTKGLPCTLTPEWVEAELTYALEHGCPYLGIPVTLDVDGNSPDSPSIDRWDSSLGYTQDNCLIVSRRANAIKNDATVAEFLDMARRLAAIAADRTGLTGDEVTLTA